MIIFFNINNYSVGAVVEANRYNGSIGNFRPIDAFRCTTAAVASLTAALNFEKYDKKLV